MKLQVKQLDEATANSIAFALEMYAEYVGQINENRADTYRELAVMFRHSIPLLVSEGYDVKDNNIPQELPHRIYVHRSHHWGLIANEHNITKDGVGYIRADALSPVDDVQVLGPHEKGGEEWK